MEPVLVYRSNEGKYLPTAEYKALFKAAGALGPKHIAALNAQMDRQEQALKAATPTPVLADKIETLGKTVDLYLVVATSLKKQRQAPTNAVLSATYSKATS